MLTAREARASERWQAYTTYLYLLERLAWWRRQLHAWSSAVTRSGQRTEAEIAADAAGAGRAFAHALRMSDQADAVFVVFELGRPNR